MKQNKWAVNGPSIGRILRCMRMMMMMMMMIFGDDINEDDLKIMNMHGGTILVWQRP